MQLSGLHIADKYIREPVHPDQIQPATVDLTLNNFFLYLQDDADRIHYRRGKLPKYTGVFNDVLVLRPGQFVLGCTVETVALDGRVAGRIEGKSTLGRLGVVVHITAGFIDPGYVGRPTLEFYNLGPRVVELRKGDPVAQLAVYQMMDYAETLDMVKYQPRRYAGNYQADVLTVGARWKVNEQ